VNVAKKTEEKKNKKEQKSINKGKIVAIIGPVIDVSFEGAELPDILNALEVYNKFLGKKIVLEVAQEIGRAHV